MRTRIGVERAQPRAVAFNPLVDAQDAPFDERTDGRGYLHYRGQHIARLRAARLRTYF